MSFCLVGIFESLKECSLASRQVAGEVKVCFYIFRSISDNFIQQLLTFYIIRAQKFTLQLLSSFNNNICCIAVCKQ